MHEAVLVHADVHECAEGDDIRHHAIQLHALAQVLRLRHVVPERHRLERRTRVAARLSQLDEDVLQRRQPDVIGHIGTEVERLDLRFVGDQFGDGDPDVLRHALDERVAFRVHGACVQRMLAAAHAQEARGLFECLGAEARDVEQRAA